MFDLLALGRATQAAVLKLTPLRMGPHVGFCQWRPWNEMVAQGPGRILLPEGFGTAPTRKLPLSIQEWFCLFPRKIPIRWSSKPVLIGENPANQS